MTIGRDRIPAYAKSIGNLADIEVAVRVHAYCMRRNEIAGRAAIGADPAQQDIAVRIENTDVPRQIMPDGTVDERLLPYAPPQV